MYLECDCAESCQDCVGGMSVSNGESVFLNVFSCDKRSWSCVLRVGSRREECVGIKVQISLEALRLGGCFPAWGVGEVLADVFGCEFACFIASRRRNRFKAKVRVFGVGMNEWCWSWRSLLGGGDLCWVEAGTHDGIRIEISW